MTIEEILSALQQGAKANREDRFRQGNMIHLPGEGRVIMTGDMHGHERNFDRLVDYARLGENPDTHLILHELIHSNTQDIPDQCHSYRLASKAARLKVEFPHQVHILMGNHEMSQVGREEILKNDLPMVRALNSGLYAEFSDKSNLVMQSLDSFILSMPLAVRTANRIWLSHSLPNKNHLKNFDDFIFEKILSLEDIHHDRSLRALLWGRRHTKECIEQLGELWGIDVFIVGHQPQPQGWLHAQPHLIILASEHNHGCFLPFDLSRSYTPEDLVGSIRPLAELY